MMHLVWVLIGLIKMDMKMKSTAIAVTNGFLGSDYGKTTHGLIRGSERFKLVAVIDDDYAGRDAGEVLDGNYRGIPVYGMLDQLMDSLDIIPDYAVIGIATEGGKLPESWLPLLIEIVSRGISLVAGTHFLLTSYPELVEAAQKSGAELIDIRKPKPVQDLHFFSGKIYEIDTPRIAVLGTDCAVGKRTTCRMIMDECRSRGITAEMIYTGQTGWMQGYPHGFILDATPNDFVSGELERAIVECAQECDPDLILVEGQSALRNPTGPCGSELMLSGNIKHVVLQYPVFREYIENVERPEFQMPLIQDEIKLIEMYGAAAIGVCLNGAGGSREALIIQQEKIQKELDIPVIRPLEEGVEALIPEIRNVLP